MGITKNAVVGRAHRLGLPKRASPIAARRGRAPARSHGVRPLVARGAAVVQRARDNSIGAAEGFRTRGAEGGAGPSSLAAPPTFSPPRVPFMRGAGCRFPLWGDDERPTHRYCGAAQAQRADGVPCAYCPAHAARCFKVSGPPASVPGVVRRTFAWGGVSA
jgi:GcrA cell cycle regulator